MKKGRCESAGPFALSEAFPKFVYLEKPPEFAVTPTHCISTW
jgi:hypothetical protein